jgi:hypothetical protein
LLGRSELSDSASSAQNCEDACVYLFGGGSLVRMARHGDRGSSDQIFGNACHDRPSGCSI